MNIRLKLLNGLAKLFRVKYSTYDPSQYDFAATWYTGSQFGLVGIRIAVSLGNTQFGRTYFQGNLLPQQIRQLCAALLIEAEKAEAQLPIDLDIPDEAK